jgi:hypothetical protein
MTEMYRFKFHKTRALVYTIVLLVVLAVVIVRRLLH